jgi:hypothetical protein
LLIALNIRLLNSSNIQKINDIMKTIICIVGAIVGFFLLYCTITAGIIGIAVLSNGSPYPIIQHPLYMVLNSIFCAGLSIAGVLSYYYTEK